MPLARSVVLALPLAAALSALGCAEDATAEPPPPCDQKCQDGTALRALRETMKLVFNLTLQGKPVGAHDETVDCPQGGTARIFGTAFSNPVQGASEVDLTYELDGCAYLQKDDEAPENYRLTLTGTITQKGTIAVQPSATTALTMKSTSMTLSGTVHEPPLPYDERACALEISQSGNDVSGTLCERVAGFTF